jgi:hypothetical protein
MSNLCKFVVYVHDSKLFVLQIQLMDFAQRMRVERMSGSISVYSSEPLSRSQLATSNQYNPSNSIREKLTGLCDTHTSAHFK